MYISNEPKEGRFDTIGRLPVRLLLYKWILPTLGRLLKLGIVPPRLALLKIKMFSIWGELAKLGTLPVTSVLDMPINLRLLKFEKLGIGPLNGLLPKSKCLKTGSKEKFGIFPVI